MTPATWTPGQFADFRESMAGVLNSNGEVHLGELGRAERRHQHEHGREVRAQRPRLDPAAVRAERQQHGLDGPTDTGGGPAGVVPVLALWICTGAPHPALSVQVRGPAVQIPEKSMI